MYFFKFFFFCGLKTERTLEVIFGFVYFIHSLCLECQGQAIHGEMHSSSPTELLQMGVHGTVEIMLKMTLQSFHTNKIDTPVRQAEAGDHTNQ